MLRAGVSKTKTSQPNRRASFRLVSLRRRTPDQYRTQPKQHRMNRNLSRYRSDSDRYQLVVPICRVQSCGSTPKGKGAPNTSRHCTEATGAIWRLASASSWSWSPWPCLMRPPLGLQTSSGTLLEFERPKVSTQLRVEGAWGIRLVHMNFCISPA